MERPDSLPTFPICHGLKEFLSSRHMQRLTRHLFLSKLLQLAGTCTCTVRSHCASLTSEDFPTTQTSTSSAYRFTASLKLWIRTFFESGEVVEAGRNERLGRKTWCCGIFKMWRKNRLDKFFAVLTVGKSCRKLKHYRWQPMTIVAVLVPESLRS